jgi:hypothetical protein
VPVTPQREVVGRVRAALRGWRAVMKLQETRAVTPFAVATDEAAAVLIALSDFSFDGVGNVSIAYNEVFLGCW